VRLAAESDGDSPVSIYGTHPKLRSCDCGDNPDGTLAAQCADSFGRHSHGDRGRILFPSLAPGMVLDCTRGLDRLDGGGFKHGVRIFGRRGVTEFSSCSARRQGCSCRRGADNCARVISDRRNHFLATCEGPVGPLTRSTRTEIFVMSSEYVIPTHLLLFSRQTNS